MASAAVVKMAAAICVLVLLCLGSDLMAHASPEDQDAGAGKVDLLAVGDGGVACSAKCKECYQSCTNSCKGRRAGSEFEACFTPCTIGARCDDK
ncbi:hypothetical protein ACP70R_006847 [Stipagrostis hirtigluma subsp. patula]